MASLSPPTTTTRGAYSSFTGMISSLSSCPFLNNTSSQISITKRRTKKSFYTVSCKAIDKHEHDQNTLGKFDRRNVVIGIGGLYSAVNLNPLALADPIMAPDLATCTKTTSTGKTEVAGLECCPPISDSIMDFKLPPPPKRLRVRPVAHLVDQKYIDKYSRAIQLMKELPYEDPRNFIQQAKIHCAYCDGSYPQVGFPKLAIEVHFSWLFFPFHRWYLYFYEKILGSLIDDPDFTLPFWNWDAGNGGMQMPPMFTNPSSSLYDPLRNQAHLPPTMIDLQNGERDPPTLTDDQLLQNNLATMRRQMLSNGGDALTFLGGRYTAGDAFYKATAGTIESIPHNTVHKWCGDPRQFKGQHMGAFFSAGLDPLFYCHHANVDRMWDVRQALKKRIDKEAKKKGLPVKPSFYDPDWGETEFLFYDEKKQLVRVKVKDSVSSAALGYTYKDVGLPWLNIKPKPKFDKAARKAKKLTRSAPPVITTAKLSDFPIKLEKDKVVRVSVPRPIKTRTKKNKEDNEEVLIIQGIELDSGVYVKFDVYVNDEDEGAIGPGNTEFAGSFVNIPHSGISDDEKMKTGLRLVISELLEDLGSEDDDDILVSLVPKFESADDEITIGGIKIEA